MENSFKEAEKELIILYKDVYLSYIINVMIRKKYEEILELYKKIWYLDDLVKSRSSVISEIIYEYDPNVVKLNDTEKRLLREYRVSNTNWLVSELKKISAYEKISFVPRSEPRLDFWVRISMWAAFLLVLLRVII